MKYEIHKLQLTQYTQSEADQDEKSEISLNTFKSDMNKEKNN